MPRTARNIVEFFVDGQALRARFVHQHAKEDPKEFVDVSIWEEQLKPIEIVEVNDQHRWQSSERKQAFMIEKKLVKYQRDRKVIEPVLIAGGNHGHDIGLRHLTTCSIERFEGGDWVLLGSGQARCSVKDKYDWRKGIKDSLYAAVIASGLRPVGAVLHAYFEEVNKRPDDAAVAGDVTITLPVVK